jgi:hypothetical protein
MIIVYILMYIMLLLSVKCCSCIGLQMKLFLYVACTTEMHTVCPWEQFKLSCNVRLHTRTLMYFCLTTGLVADWPGGSIPGRESILLYKTITWEPSFSWLQGEFFPHVCFGYEAGCALYKFYPNDILLTLLEQPESKRLRRHLPNNLPTRFMV